MIPWLCGVLVLAGAGFVLVAAIGLVRLPDALTRMHATTKAGVLGVGMVMIAVAIADGSADVMIRAVGAALLVWTTTPVACHLLGRASYFSPDVELSSRTVIDELADRYDPSTHACSGQTTQTRSAIGDGEPP